MCHCIFWRVLKKRVIASFHLLSSDWFPFPLTIFGVAMTDFCVTLTCFSGVHWLTLRKRNRSDDEDQPKKIARDFDFVPLFRF